MSNKDAKAGASQPDSSEDEQTSTTQASGKATPERGPPPSPPQSAAQLYGREQCANWAKPDSDLLYLMTGAPPLASSYGGRPAHEPRAVTQTLYDAIQAAYTARNKEVKYHLLNFKVPKNLPRSDRARVTSAVSRTVVWPRTVCQLGEAGLRLAVPYDRCATSR